MPDLNLTDPQTVDLTEYSVGLRAPVSR